MIVTKVSNCAEFAGQKKFFIFLGGFLESLKSRKILYTKEGDIIINNSIQRKIQTSKFIYKDKLLSNRLILNM